MSPTAAEATGWISVSTVSCRAVVAGVLGDLSIAVTSGDRVGSYSSSVSYDQGTMSVVERSNVVEGGGVSISVVGAELGRKRYPQPYFCTFRLFVGHLSKKLMFMMCVLRQYACASWTNRL